MSKKELILQLLNTETTYPEIMKIVGCNKSTISYHAKRNQLLRIESAGRRYDWKVISDYQIANDCGFTRCKEEFGISWNAWRDALKRGDVSVNKRHDAPTDPFAKWSRRRNSANLKRLLLKSGALENRCYGENCSVTNEWLGKPITLQLDHIDGDGLNNDVSNLRLLCANCHSQTNTFAGKNLNFYKNKYGKAQD